jgi:maltooligosyltrehalose synthase
MPNSLLEQPLGEKIWQDTWLELDTEKGEDWRNTPTGATLTGERKWPIGQILTHFPVAILTSFRHDGQRNVPLCFRFVW